MPGSLVRRLGWLVLAAILISPALAEAAPPPVDREATIVDELVVTSAAGGPAWWRVSSATTTIYVMGVPEALPKGLKWDQTLLRRRLVDANVLIGPPIVTAGLGDVFALINARKHFRSRGRMEDTLPPGLQARFLADRPALTSDTRAYSGWTPLVAGLLMVSDFRKKAGLEPREPAGMITRLARDKGVKVTPAGSYRAVPLLKAAEAGLTASGPTCLTDALDEIDAGAARVKTAAQGWARGDVAAALSAQRGYEKCLNSLPEGADLVSRSMNDTTDTLAKALITPGHSVAVVNLRTLLAQGGVLQRLQARGYKVTRPE